MEFQFKFLRKIHSFMNLDVKFKIHNHSNLYLRLLKTKITEPATQNAHQILPHFIIKCSLIKEKEMRSKMKCYVPFCSFLNVINNVDMHGGDVIKQIYIVLCNNHAVYQMCLYFVSSQSFNSFKLNFYFIHKFLLPHIFFCCL